MPKHSATVNAFREAASAGDPDRMASLFAPDARFCSPAVHAPYEGHAAVMKVLTAAFEVLHPLRYSEVVESDDRAVLFFHAEVGGLEVEGIDALRFDDDGRISELLVMIRPLSALKAVVEAMARALGLTPAG
jgi:hypothetical protein